MKVLVIYELIPEDTKMYLVEANGADLERLKAAHGVYVNYSDDDDDAVWLNDWLGGWQVLEIERGQPIAAEFDLVVYSGFGL